VSSTKMTKRDIILELRRYGYEGPVSYSRDKLLELLRGVRDVRKVELPQAQAPADETGAEHKVKVFSYEDLTPDLEFQVTGEPGAWFRFHAHVTNTKTGEEWIDAAGGTKYHQMFRAFHVGRIRRKRSGEIKTRPCRRAVDEEMEDA
jgi:hypothetical protein